MNPIRITAAGFVLLLLAAQPIFAQDAPRPEAPQIADPALLEAAATEHERATERTRSDLLELLESEQVKRVAEERGIDLAEASATAAALSDDAVSAAAPLVEAATAALQRGSTVTISVSALIIILLLLILLT